MERFGLQEGGKAQQVLDKSVIDWNLQYVPWETGALGKSAYGATQIGSGEIVYPGPYAHYMYYGEVYGPNIWNGDGHVKDAPQPFFSPKGEKKHPTGREIVYAQDVNPLAGPFWADRMKADHMDDILQEVKSVVGK